MGSSADAGAARVQAGIVAGETSGDLLGAALIAALHELEPRLRFAGIGGPQMTQAGCEILYPAERLSVMGLVEVLGRLPELLAIRRDLRGQLLARRPAVFIGVDAPDFNLSLERRLRQAGIPTVHYVSPSVWAWRKYRVRKIARAADLLLALFPFEVDFYAQHGVNARFVGHPLADAIPLNVDQAAARRLLELPAGAPVVALLPGSRTSEVSRLAEPFLATAHWCWQRRPELRFVLPVAGDHLNACLDGPLTRFANLPLRIVAGQSHAALAAADAVLVASGTAALECLLFKRPMLVAYRLAAPTYWLVRRLLRVAHFSLPNLLAGESLVDELVQDAVTPDIMGPKLLDLLDDNGRRQRLVERFTRIHHQLRRGASREAARAVLDLVQSRGVDLSPH